MEDKGKGEKAKRMRFEDHEDYGLYEEIRSKLAAANQREDWDEADKLTDQLNAINRSIHLQIGTKHPILNDPDVQQLEEAFSDLRKARSAGDQAGENQVWNTIVEISAKLDTKYNPPSKN